MHVSMAWLVWVSLSLIVPISSVVLVGNNSDWAPSPHDAGTLMRREHHGGLAAFTELNPAENARSYSSIWGNNAIGTGHARSMLDSPQAWSAAANNQDQWMIMNLGALKAVKGAYFQARNAGSCCGNQIVTKVYFEYSKDCTDYTPVEGSRLFATGVVANSATKYFVPWLKPLIAKCVKVCVDSWSGHISMRVGLSARTPEGDDQEDVENIAVNPPEASRSYSSIWGNNAIGTGHARSMLDSPQAWSAASNDKHQWMIIRLTRLYNVAGVYFQGRNKGSCCGNQIVTQVSFQYSSDCSIYEAVDDGRVFETGVTANTNMKYFVQWSMAKQAKCVKILVDDWSGHISMRVGLSVGSLNGVTTVFFEDQSAFNATSTSKDLTHEQASWSTYGDGSAAHVAEDFPPQAPSFDHYGDGMPSYTQ